MSHPQTPLPEPADDQLSAIESILLVSGGPVSLASLATALATPKSRLTALLLRLQEELLPRGIRLQLSEGNAQLVTAPENVEMVQRFLGTARTPALSRPALETLTIIAYHQPATRAEIESLRGVNSDRAVLTLLARGLIEVRGERQTVGRPREYGTGFGFLEYFGLASLDDLPPLESEPSQEEVSASGIGLRVPKND